jgi:hypothetical protein
MDIPMPVQRLHSNRLDGDREVDVKPVDGHSGIQPLTIKVKTITTYHHDNLQSTGI